MTTQQVIGDIDLVGAADVKRLGEATGPCVSAYVPTHRHGPETTRDPVRLSKLLDQAESDADKGGFDKADVAELTVPLRDLLDDKEFWQHQADGLAAFASRNGVRTFRLPISVDEEVTVGPAHRVRPLVPLLWGDQTFLLLALSQNAVRLFRGTAHTIGELDPGPIPASMGEALAHEDPERQLQFRSGGGSGGSAVFHGHGAGDEVDKGELERYFRQVDKGLLERLGPLDEPLVLACVAYYVPIYREVSSYPDVLDTAAEGNPDHSSPQDLHAAAWPLVEDRLTARRAAHLDRYREAAGTGATAASLADVARAAAEGRVDTLFVTPGPPRWGRLDGSNGQVTESAEQGPSDVDLVDRALLDTLGTSGRVVTVPEPVEDGEPAAAILRY